MKIRRLQIKNIRSYEQQEFSFPEGSLLLAGDIGSGKTSILLSIEYALFGLQPGQSGASLLRNESDFGEVVLNLDIDGQEVIIERRLRRSTKTIANEYAAITINGEKKECSITELKTLVLQLLGYPSEFLKKNNLLYRYTVYTPQEQMKQIILEDPETRLNILRHIFGIDKYRIIRENALFFVGKLKDEVKVLQGEIKTLDLDKNKLESLKNEITLLTQRVSEKFSELSNVVTIRKAVESEVSQWEEKMKEREMFERKLEKAKVLSELKKEQLSDTARQIAELNKIISDIGPAFDEKTLQEVTQNIIERKAVEEGLNSTYMEINSKIHSNELAKKEKFENKQRIFQLVSCPTCLQKVPDAHKYSIFNAAEKELSDIDKSLVILHAEKEKILKSIMAEKQNLASLDKKKQQLEIHKANLSYQEQTRNKLKEYLKKQESQEKDLSFLSIHMQGLKEDILKSSTFVAQHKLKQDELKKGFVEEKNVEISLAELKKEAELVNREISSLQDIINQKESSRKRMDGLLELSEWISSNFISLVNFTERTVMMKLRHEFSKLFSKWFQTLAGDTFNIQLDENFTPLVMHGNTEMDYAFLSGGERTAVALAYRLALNQIINAVLSTIKTKDIVILDEPTDGFSETQLEKMRDVLEELQVKQLIVVSHEPKVEGFVDNIIRLRKDGSTSQVESTTTIFS